MPEAQTAKPVQQSQPVPFKRNAAPKTIKEAWVGQVRVSLKHWEEKNRFTIEISQPPFKDGGQWQQVSFGEFEATGVADAISSMRSLATR